MAYQSESIKGIKIRVFNWMQNMIKNRVIIHNHHQLGSSSRFGFLVLRVTNRIRIVRPRTCDSKKRGGQFKKTTFKKSVQLLKICETPEEFVESIDFALRLSNLFFKDTTPHLANAIYDYLSSSFGKNLNIWSNVDDEFSKIVVAIDVDMESGRFEILSKSCDDICKFRVTDLYETLINDDDNNEENKGEFCLQVDGVRKKRKIDMQILEVEYTFDDRDVEDILDTLLDFLTKKKGFNNKIEAFDGKKQEFIELKSGLKITKLKKENVMNFELGDICPVCFEIFKEKSIIVITPCSHIFHRSCLFTWLSENNTCPICRKDCDV
ncbi:uncharacterized protein [Solanum lycopersicum]|uniref:uncharacterized protein n=1 Tax=Solanum lycopersicum TaxID=4081 RepID=UPI0037494584